MLAVILSGGSGTRLWPLSRTAYPKQFLKFSAASLLQQTVERTVAVTRAQPLVVCNEEHRFFVAEQLREINVSAAGILLEPEGKNTAPAIAAAATYLQQRRDQDPVMLVMPSDHIIADIASFKTVVERAQPLAEAGRLVTFGIVPDVAETGYGYIQTGAEVPASGGTAFEVRQFVEKPDPTTATQYVESGDYLWNSGIFMFRASSILSELEKFSPELLPLVARACSKAEEDFDFTRLNRDEFVGCMADSIDYAVMEKSSEVVVVPMTAGWNDVGSWSALWDVVSKDARGNCSVGDVVDHDSHNCYFYSSSKLLASVGLNDIVAIETEDAVLVAAKDRVQDVKAIVGHLKSGNRREAEYHRKVYRPWGYYDSIDRGERFQVKRIMVNPGAKLSLQMHHHRAEHWVVVKGTALVTRSDEKYLVSENESTFIPLGVKHQLENPGTIPLEMIEIQSGSYLEEDDIIRFSEEEK